jgi:hypothetical protein
LTQGATAQRLSQQLTASQTQFVGGAQQQQHQQPHHHQQQEEGSLETRIDYLRSFFLLDELSHTLCLFAQAAATPVWGATEFLHLNNQLKQLVVHTKVMYERVQQFLARYPFEEKRITDATVVVQNNIRGLVISVKQLNEAQARGVRPVVSCVVSCVVCRVVLWELSCGACAGYGGDGDQCGEGAGAGHVPDVQHCRGGRDPLDRRDRRRHPGMRSVCALPPRRLKRSGRLTEHTTRHTHDTHTTHDTHMTHTTTANDVVGSGV